MSANDAPINGLSAARGDKRGYYVKPRSKSGHDTHDGETNLASLMRELGENTLVVEAMREIGDQRPKLTTVVVKSWLRHRKRCRAGTIKLIYAIIHMWWPS